MSDKIRSVPRTQERDEAQREARRVFDKLPAGDPVKNFPFDAGFVLGWVAGLGNDPDALHFNRPPAVPCLEGKGHCWRGTWTNTEAQIGGIWECGFCSHSVSCDDDRRDHPEDCSCPRCWLPF